MNSLKYKYFVSEQMGDKEISVIPGICENSIFRLENLGFDYAYMLLGQFFVLYKNEEAFHEWLVSKTGMSKQSSKLSAKSMTSWCEAFM
jgi:hypothetical protein